MVYISNNPPANKRVDYNGALIASTLANINRDTKKKPEPFVIKDFLLDYRKQKKEPSKGDNLKVKVKSFLNTIRAHKRGSK